MAQSYTRLELYDLVWSEPMRNLAARFGMSDVYLAKICRGAAVPVPPRGYWNRKQAGHAVAKFPLPPREPGHSETVDVSNRYWQYRSQAVDENAPEPPEPRFDETLESVRARVEKRTPAVKAAPTLEIAHPAIRALLAKDDRRREKQRAAPYAWDWYAPIFDTPLQKRRLRILNAILLALAKQGYGGVIRGEKGEEITLQLGLLSIQIELTEIKASGGKAKDAPKPKSERLRLATKPGYKTIARTIADDLPGKPIESRLRSIVIDLIVLGEECYREHALEQHQRQVQWRLEQIEDARRKKLEAERREQERLAALEKARIDRLLDEAASLQTAQNIRAYVRNVHAAAASLAAPINDKDLAAWTTWALAQADRIDPVLSRRFLDIQELNSDKEAL